VYRRHACAAADEQNLVDRMRVDLRGVEYRRRDAHRLLEEIGATGLELLATEREREIAKLAADFDELGDSHLDTALNRQRALRMLGGLTEPRELLRSRVELDPLSLLELLEQVRRDPLVEVEAPQEVVAARAHDLEPLRAHVEDRHIERATAEVEHGEPRLLAAAEPVGDRRRRGLVDDASDVETGRLPGLAHELALHLAEVGRNRDHRARDARAEVGLRDGAHLREEMRGHLLHGHHVALERGAEAVAFGLDDRIGVVRLVLLGEILGVGAADEALRAVHRPPGVEDEPLGRRFTDEDLPARTEGYDRGNRVRPVSGRDHLGPAVCDEGCAGRARAEVDPDREAAGRRAGAACSRGELYLGGTLLVPGAAGHGRRIGFLSPI
jgi:hypothetical protein